MNATTQHGSTARRNHRALVWAAFYQRLNQSNSRLIASRASVILLWLFYLTPLAQAGPIVGAWWGCCGESQGVFALVFFSNGEYVHLERGSSIADPSGQSGMERGTYTSDVNTGAFTRTTLLDTNGEWGLSHGDINYLSGSGDLLTGSGPSAGTFSIPRLVDSNSPLVGAWYFRDSPDPGDLVVIAFLPNGEFLIGIDPPTGGYIQYGTYSWNPLTGVFNATLNGSTAPPGSDFGLPGFTSATVQNDMLNLSGSTSNVSLHTAAVPEPASTWLILAGVAAIGIRARRRGA